MENKPQIPQGPKESAKDAASRHIGENGLLYIVLLVLIGVGSLAFLPAVSHAPVIGLVAGACTALIGMIQGITGASDKPEKQEKPEMVIIQDLVARLDKRDPMKVEVDNDKVVVSKGDETQMTCPSKKDNG